METAIEPIAFGDGKYQLRLTLKQIFEIERSCGFKDHEGITRPKSIYIMLDELEAGLGQQQDTEQPVYLGGGAAHARDIREVIRCALIGGNSGFVAGEEIEVGPGKAQQLVDEYLFPARPLVEGQYIAWAVLNAVIRGVTLKKKAEEAEQPIAGDSTGGSSSPTADSLD
ncbi:hypothetical protein [Stakelama pacifica]|uniref:Uncharacterized protein n=1 Tax=Stakelama pacifica TaxID=517720 RepID=A0A4V3BT29_9SPHN|nr:hypothetical protein [Stakelama pacifica]TDN81788.1 hypothetical protein EV664_107190 [Stakelama pacifica]GGO96571.1 hypothetical protein GCM10011329_23410 [Stakelama pacifica]